MHTDNISAVCTQFTLSRELNGHLTDNFFYYFYKTRIFIIYSHIQDHLKCKILRYIDSE